MSRETVEKGGWNEVYSGFIRQFWNQKYSAWITKNSLGDPLRSEEKKGPPWIPNGNSIRFLLLGGKLRNFDLWWLHMISMKRLSFLFEFELWKHQQKPRCPNKAEQGERQRRGEKTCSGFCESNISSKSSFDRWRRFPSWSWERSVRFGKLSRRKIAKCRQLLNCHRLLKPIPTVASLPWPARMGSPHQQLWEREILSGGQKSLEIWRRSWGLSLSSFSAVALDQEQDFCDGCSQSCDFVMKIVLIVKGATLIPWSC